MSTKQAMTTPVAINASFVKFVRIKNAVRNAPWFPESPPKKPLKRPPRKRYLMSNCSLVNFGLMSKRAKTKRRIPIISFIGTT